MAGETERLEPNGVALWMARIDDVAPQVWARAEAWLDDEESARAARFRMPGARAQFVAARALLRAALTRYGGRAPGDWRLRVDANGKPVLDAADPAFVFNLSHTQEVVACAFARRGEIGVDVETLAASDDLIALARTAFSAPEIAHLERLDRAERSEAFFAYWTLKEAYVKARGLGLSLDTTRFRFDLDKPITLHRLDGAGADPAYWRFLRLSPTPRTRLALAVAAPLALAGVTPRWIGLEEALA